MRKKKIGIIRGFMPRMAQVEFAASFRRFEPTFITGGMGEAREMGKYCHRNGLKWVDLPLKPIYGIDPVGLLTGSVRHQSWVGPGFHTLIEACKGLEALETYEMYHFFSGQAADVARKLNIPLVVEVWTSFRHPAYFLPPYSFYARKVMNAASLFVARSKKAKEALVKLGIQKSKIKVIYHGVNVAEFRRDERKREGEGIRVLYVGSITKEKGVGVLIDVWSRIHKEYPGTRLWLVGSGPLKEEAKRVAGIKVVGWVEHAKLPAIYGKADIFVSPSVDRKFGPFLWWEEFFSYTLMEAQSSGLPIVGSDSGGIPEEVGKDNILVQQNKKDDLYRALVSLISDRGLRIRLGEKNRRRALKYFNLVKQTELLENKILELL